MSSITADDLEQLREVFDAVWEEIDSGSFVTAKQLAEAGKHNVDQLVEQLDGTIDSEETTEE